MKLEVVMNGEKKELDLKGLKGREIDALIKEMVKMQNAAEGNVGEAYEEYMAKQKQYACTVSGLTVEQLDDLDSDDRAKIFDYLNDKIQKAMGFSKLLSQ